MIILKKKWFVLTLIFTLLASYSLPFTPGVQAAEPISVANAIANNSGTATVKGYIVGYTKSGPTYQFTGPFTDDTNFAIADSPTETAKAKILPVQLSSVFRAKFGLKTNPSNIGKQVVVTGSLEAYFGVPGLKSPTAVEFAGEGGPVDPPPATGIEGLKIHDIQGESHSSPYKDKDVKGVEGIVTHIVDVNNFYMQDAASDNNSKTSEAILVYKKNHGMTKGDHVSVNGLVKEWVLDGYNDKLQTDLAVTEINADTQTITKKASGQALPLPLVIGKDVIPPSKIIDNDIFSAFDPEQDGIDFYESLEGMRVALESPIAVGPQKYGEVPVIIGKVEGKTYTTPGGVPIQKDNFNPERLQLLFGDRNFVSKTGDRFDGTVTGVVSYSFQNYKILTDKASLPKLVESNYEREVSQLVKDEKKLTIASYNMENYTAANAEKTNKIAESIVNNLHSPDILGLVEVQDNNGESTGGTDASQNYQALINAIAANGGPTYKWTDIAPENNQDGGAPNGNIRVGYIYNAERVSLAQAPKGSATEATSYENGSLTLNPGRIDPTNAAFSSSRKPLAAEFVFNGEEVIVIANHFNSKGGDQPLFGKNQPPVLGSETQRMNIARTVNSFVKDIETKNPKANVVVLGDLNDFEFSNPLVALKGSELSNLIEKVPAEERFTYNYQGNSQVLDHMLVSNNLAEKAEVDIVHLNSPFTEAHGRVSDHDPVMAQIDLRNIAVPKPLNLSIMHVNDSHAHVEQYPKLITAVKEVRSQKAHSLLLDAGDVFSGTLYFQQYKGLADVEFMNELKYDAMTFGNHEFDKDSATLADFIKKAQFPIVSANVNVTKDPVLQPLFKNEVSSAPQGGSIYPAIIKEIDGEKVAIFGLTTEETTFLANPSDEIVFENAVEKAKATVAELQGKGINKIIALTHLGENVDEELANAVDGIDVIVGGHSHTKLTAPVVVPKAEPTLVVQANEYLNFLGLLDVSFDEKGVITAHNGKLLDLKTYSADAKAAARVAELRAPLDALKNKVVGFSSVLLNGDRASVRTKETNLGNLIADAMVQRANESLPTFIGFQNGGGIRASIDTGDVTLGEILTVMPFENQLVTLNLTGEEIRQALEISVSQVETAQGKFLQVSGVKMKYDPAKPAGERVWSVEVRSANGYEKLDPTKMYNVATNAFVADGGDGYTVFKKAKDEGRMKELFVVDYEVLTSYFESNSPVAPTVEGRIIAAKAKPAAPSVNPVTDADGKITGTAEAGIKVIARAGGQEIGSGTASEQGAFYIAISKQKAGTEITVVAVNSYGNESDPVNVVVADVTAPSAPEVEKVTDADDKLTGKAEARATITAKAGGLLIGTAIADVEGKFIISIPKQKAGTKISVTATDQAGNESAAEVVVVIDVTPPAVPEVAPVTDKDTAISGKAEAGSIITVILNGKEIGKGMTDGEGKFKVMLNASLLNISSVSVRATDAAGNQSGDVMVKVKDTTAPEAPIVDTVSKRDYVITGKAEANARVEMNDGFTVRTVTADAAGNFTFSLTEPFKQHITLTFTAIDAGNNVSAKTIVKVEARREK